MSIVNFSSESLNLYLTDILLRLKKLYRDFREELGQTGHGLVENDMVDEIQEGTPLANVWGK